MTRQQCLHTVSAWYHQHTHAQMYSYFDPNHWNRYWKEAPALTLRKLEERPLNCPHSIRLSEEVIYSSVWQADIWSLWKYMHGSTVSNGFQAVRYLYLSIQLLKIKIPNKKTKQVEAYLECVFNYSIWVHVLKLTKLHFITVHLSRNKRNVLIIPEVLYSCMWF